MRPLTVNGRTHANGSIYTGTIDQLTFNTLVTMTGSLSSPAWDGHTTSQYSDAAKYNAGYSTNWQQLSLPIGTTNVHQLIDMPPAGGYTNLTLAQQAYYNIADLVLLVSNSTVTLTLKNSPSDPLATNITANYFPTNSSPDQLRPDHQQLSLSEHHQLLRHRRGHQQWLHRSAGGRPGEGDRY